MPVDVLPAKCACGRTAFRRGLCRACCKRGKRTGQFTPRDLRGSHDVIEDVEWMLDTGETHPAAVATRLGYTTRSGLYIALRRAGRRDLIDRLTDAGPEYCTLTFEELRRIARGA